MDEENKVTEENSVQEKDVNKVEDSKSQKKKLFQKISDKLDRAGTYIQKNVPDNIFDNIVKAVMVCFLLIGIMIISDVLNAFRIEVHFSPEANIFHKGTFFLDSIFDLYRFGYTFLVILSAYMILKGLLGSTYQGAVKLRFHFIRYTATILLIIALILLFYKKANITIEIGTKAKVAYVIIGLVLLIVFRFTYSIPKDVNIWDTDDAYHIYGVPLTLLSSRDYSEALAYGNYNEELINSALSKYTADEYDSTKHYPNIIFVLNESFCDIDDIYKVNPKVDPIPNYHEIIQRDNIIKGEVYSPVYGGGTCIPEFELITGKSASIINPNFSPYLIVGPEHYKSSIMLDLKKYDYTTYGLHTYYGSGYNRNRIYGVLGFDKYMFSEDLDEGEEWFQNSLISDKVTYKYLFRELDNKKPGERAFDFVLTVQNHIPYEYKPYTFEDDDENKQPKYVEDEELNSYLSLLKLSDNSLKDLVDYVDNMEEDTVLVFLGDHQPEIKALGENDRREKYSKDDAYKKVVQFFIYANFDIEEKDGVRTTMYFLPNIVYELLDLPMTEYYKYVYDLRQEIPVINSEYYEDRYGNRYDFSEDSLYYKKLEEFFEISKYELFN